MIGWYWRLHSWNRILLTALVAALATTAVLGTLTPEHVTVMPFVTAFIWGSGWAVICAGRFMSGTNGTPDSARRSAATRSFT